MTKTIDEMRNEIAAEKTAANKLLHAYIDLLFDGVHKLIMDTDPKYKEISDLLDDRQWLFNAIRNIAKKRERQIDRKFSIKSNRETGNEYKPTR